MIPADKYSDLEKFILPKAIEDLMKIIEENKRFLNFDQKKWFENGIIIHKGESRIIGQGTNQLVLRLNSYQYDNVDYPLCVKIRKNPSSHAPSQLRHL